MWKGINEAMYKMTEALIGDQRDKNPYEAETLLALVHSMEATNLPAF